MPTPTTTRVRDVRRFYSLLDELALRLGGTRILAHCSGRMAWPLRGVYFFFEHGEDRTESGTGPRVVRVGTHGLAATSSAKLWTRLSQHRGPRSSGRGNHRGSIFRLLVGAAVIELEGTGPVTWGAPRGMDNESRDEEWELERRVSDTIGRMPLLHLEVDDPPGPASARGTIERNAIALLSNARGVSVDQASSVWLGRSCPRERVRQSGLWNQNHVEEQYDPAFLDLLEERVLMTPIVG